MRLYRLAQGIVVDRVWDEVAVTVPKGDVVVLNATAAIVFDAIGDGCDEEGASQALAGALGIGVERAVAEVRKVLIALRKAGVITPVASQADETTPDVLPKPATLGRREFALGAFAALAAALQPLSGIAEEPSSGFGSWGEGESSERIWYDPLGRAIALPDKIEKIAPFGAFAHSVMETIAPEKIVHVTSWGMRASTAEGTREFMDVMGGVEMCVCDYCIETEQPDIILSIVPAESAIAMNEVASENDEGVPIVHIVAGARDLGSLYRTLAVMLESSRAAQIADSMDGLLVYFDEVRRTKGALASPSVFLGCGELCLETRGSGTVFQSVCDLVGVSNVAAAFGEGTISEVDPEELLESSPDLSILCPVDRTGDRRIIPYTFELWESGPFAQMGVKVIEPVAPYGWLDRSPLAIYTIGALWLADVAYGGLAEFDMPNVGGQYWRDLFGIDTEEPYGSDLAAATLAENVEDAGLPESECAEEEDDRDFEPANVEVIESQTIAKAQARMNSGWSGGGGGGGGGGYVPPPTPTPTPSAGSSSSYPVYPTLGKVYANKASDFWYKFVVEGSFDVIASAKGAYIKLYRVFNGQPSASYEAINTDDANRSFARYGATTYYLRIQSRSGSSVQHSVLIQCHQDTAIYANLPDGEGLGAAWLPTDGGAKKSTMGHTFMWALEPQHVQAMLALWKDSSKEDDRIHAWYEAGQNISQEVAAASAAYNLPISALSAAVWGILTLCEPDWVSDAVSAISANAEQGRGAILHRYIENFGTKYEVATWNPSNERMLRGPEGSIGKWGAARKADVGL